MFLDTTIIIEIFRSKRREERFKKIYRLIEDEPLFISIIQVGEISDWCLSNGINPIERIEYLKDILNILPLDKKICLKGSSIKFEMRSAGVPKFSLLDGIILASSVSADQQFLTTDSDFRKAENAIIIK